MRIHFQLILNSVTPPQPQQRERGRASPTQRCDAGTRGPERFCAPPSGGGHCRPRGVLRPAPCALFQLRAPGGCCASVRRSLAVPGPRHAWLRSADQTPRAEAGSGSTGPAGHPQVVVARARVCSPNECPRTPPSALRALTHLHFGTDRLQGLGLLGWTRLSRYRTQPGIWAVRLVWLRPAAEGKLGPRAGTPGGSLLYLNVCPLLPHPAYDVTFLSSALRIPYPTQRAHRILTLILNVVRHVWGPVTASRRPGLR